MYALHSSTHDTCIETHKHALKHTYCLYFLPLDYTQIENLGVPTVRLSKTTLQISKKSRADMGCLERIAGEESMAECIY